MSVKRPDGRKYDQLREVEIEIGIVKNATGSARFRIGDTIAVAAVYGPRELHPKHLQNPAKGIARIYYDMMSFSVTDRKRPGPSRRSRELDLVIRKAFEPVILLDNFPRAAVHVFIEIVQADAGTRCASICAASLALAHAGIPMKDLIASVSVGKIGDQVVADLTKKEEDWEDGATDMPLAYSSVLDKVTLLQLDGKMGRAEFSEALELGIESCKKIYKLQKEALRKFYESKN